jgi:5-methylcytosine-specific restriction enzyme subunit McrC
MNPVHPLRTVLLTERKSSLHRLPRADVEFLQAEHRTHLDVTPTRRRGRYLLTPAGHVGTIVGPTCRLVIRPKIPLHNLFHLLDPTGPVPATEDAATPVPGAEAFEFLAGRLANLLRERAAAGLHRGYAERAESARYLHGRLDLPAQLRQPSGSKEKLYCRYEEFTTDLVLNQLPKATAEWLLHSPLLGEPVRAALREALTAFIGVTSVPLSLPLFDAIILDRLTETYRPLLRLCRTLAEGLGPGAPAGGTPCPAFLLDMDRVFERYVTSGVARAFADRPGWHVAVQPWCPASPGQEGRPAWHVRPDVLLERAGRPFLVGDVKWKRGTALENADMYQVVAYCAVLGTSRGLLIYPGRRDRCWRYPLPRAAVSLEIRTLRVVGTRAACESSLRRLVRAMRHGQKADVKGRHNED